MLWGRHEELCSPAYWAGQSWVWQQTRPDHYRLGRSLEEEILACLLGGYGIPAEVGLAAYRRLRTVLQADPQRLLDADAVGALLAEPLTIGDRKVRYRFHAQKARFVAASFRALDAIDREAADRALRDELTSLPGIGLKTASWIVRNWRGSDEVAILDVHILRAGRNLGIFPAELVVERHYRELERKFLAFAAQIGARASTLDSVMWMTMRQIPAHLLRQMSPDASRENAPVRAREPARRHQAQLVFS